MQTSITPIDPVVTPIKTSGSLKEMPFPFGAAINANLLRSNSSYSTLVANEFASLTTENAMKFSALHPAENTYDFTDADQVVAFAIANKQRMHGHTLNWYRALPNWLINFQGDTKAWEDLLKNHIQNVVGHFKGKVASWDVVNEAIEEDGSLRNSIWLQKLGPDYIARAFEYAHQADPDALLFYNDYGHEYSSVKRTAILNLVNSLKAKGIPIHGIGLQMHTQYTQTDANLTLAITSAAATGLKVHISELDVALNTKNVSTLMLTADLAVQQAAKYKLIVQTFLAIPKAQQYGITTWNVTDGDSWIPLTYNRPDWPLLFDANYQRKTAYQAVKDAVK